MLKRFSWTVLIALAILVLACDVSSLVSQLAPGSSSSCPPFPAAQQSPPGFPLKITMAEATRGTEKDPVGSTTTFTPSSIFHAVVAIENAPANTKFTATWYALDTGPSSSCNSKIDSTDLASSGTRNLDFTLTPNNKWPAGAFRVEILVNGKLAAAQNFTVK